MLPQQTSRASDIYASDNKQAQTSHLIAGRIVLSTLSSFMLCACASDVALETLYSRWATDLLFVYQLGHMLEKVETPALVYIFGHLTEFT